MKGLMPIPTTRAELLDAIETTFSRLDRDLDRVPVEAAREPVLEGHVKGTVMSPADLVAYLIGWNRQVLIWHRRRTDGLPDEFPAAGFTWNQLGLLAQHFYDEHRHASWESLRAQLNAVKDQIVALVHDSSDEELYGATWYGKWTLGRMISLNTSSPYANARNRLRSWLRTI